MATILEQPRQVPVIADVDLCVLGGSCTGVFAAVIAARLGLRVILVEKGNGFGGVATAGLVNIWHSLYDTAGARQIIAGMTQETIDRLQRRGAVEYAGTGPSAGFYLNTDELKIELDELVLEAGVTPLLHTAYVAPHVEDGKLTAVFVENKSGRGAIRARLFIDATGDGDLCAHLGVPTRTADHLQPPSTCARLTGFKNLGDFRLYDALVEHGAEYGLPEGFAWYAPIPGLPGITMLAGSRVPDADCADATALTRAEIEGRRQIRAVMDIIRKYAQGSVGLAGLSSYIGIRETRHVECRYRLTEADILAGRLFDDAIANGSYRVDIHPDDKPGVIFRYLDGTEVYARMGFPDVTGRWREAIAADPTFYQIPYRCLVPQGPYANLLVCGRPIDADRGAFAAIRVMVNTNQTGEAAGVAAYLALDTGIPVGDVNPAQLRAVLGQQGAVVI